MTVDPNPDHTALASATANVNVSVSTAHQSVPPTINIQESLESPLPEAAQATSVIVATNAHSHSTVQRKSREQPELCFGSNKFASLISLEGEEDSSDSEKESDLMDLMTHSSKRILREKLVKSSAKAKKMHWQPTVRGHGYRERENRGGCG